MGWAPHPEAESSNRALELVARILDPVLAPLGFAPGQGGISGGQGQVIFCRSDVDRGDCVDLVLDLRASPDWRVAGVRYWGSPTDGWHVAFDRDAALPDQLSGLAQTLPGQVT